MSAQNWAYAAKIADLSARLEASQASEARLREALTLIASCEKRTDGDVIDIAQKALEKGND